MNHIYLLSLLMGLAAPAAPDSYANTAVRDTRVECAARKERVLLKQIVVPASLADVWSAWTTTDGVKTFLASDAKVELRPGGPFEIYFLPDAPAGMRGSEGCTVIEFAPMKSLAFTWNAPPKFGELRSRHTRVEVAFSRVDDTHTKVTLRQSGWKKGKQWNELYDYFDAAWGYVLESLRKRFTSGPVDWEAKFNK